MRLSVGLLMCCNIIVLYEDMFGFLNVIVIGEIDVIKGIGNRCVLIVKMYICGL